ncbi:MAG: molybdopterin-guanine dinucleotide biosynthesis protein B [Bacillales bacterium]|nr:molybdopterin-guanine dinucleotide biosynthesis protein B [Bacillales bacterium]
MEREQNIFQIVGYQNSGKTTWIEYLLEYASSHGKMVGTVKHHGHGGRPLIGDEGKDTERYRKKGAYAATVEGGNTAVITINGQCCLEDVLKLYQLLPLDLILIEGYKKASFPKAVIIHREEDKNLLELENVQAIITPFPQQFNRIPAFHVEDKESMAEWLWNYFSL